MPPRPCRSVANRCTLSRVLAAWVSAHGASLARRQQAYLIEVGGRFVARFLARHAVRLAWVFWRMALVSTFVWLMLFGMGGFLCVWWRLQLRRWAAADRALLCAGTAYDTPSLQWRRNLHALRETIDAHSPEPAPQPEPQPQPQSQPPSGAVAAPVAAPPSAASALPELVWPVPLVLPAPTRTPPAAAAAVAPASPDAPISPHSPASPASPVSLTASSLALSAAPASLAMSPALLASLLAPAPDRTSLSFPRAHLDLGLHGKTPVAAPAPAVKHIWPTGSPLARPAAWPPQSLQPLARSPMAQFTSPSFSASFTSPNASPPRPAPPALASSTAPVSATSKQQQPAKRKGALPATSQPAATKKAAPPQPAPSLPPPPPPPGASVNAPLPDDLFGPDVVLPATATRPLSVVVEHPQNAQVSHESTAAAAAADARSPHAAVAEAAATAAAAGNDVRAGVAILKGLMAKQAAAAGTSLPFPLAIRLLSVIWFRA